MLSENWQSIAANSVPLEFSIRAVDALALDEDLRAEVLAAHRLGGSVAVKGVFRQRIPELADDHHHQ